jgi:uncharacterized membrane protein
MEQEREIYLLFKGSLFLKGAISFFEIVFGTVALFIPVSAITTFAGFITQDEINEDPGNFLANHILSAAHLITTLGTVYIGLYLISRGLLKLGLIIALFKNKLWAYPWSLAVLGTFMIFQIYEIIKAHSLAVIIITLFDCVVMYSIWKEWHIVKDHLTTTR